MLSARLLKFTPCAESFRWPRASPRYNRDRLYTGMPAVDCDQLHDGVPLYGSVAVRQPKEAYHWTLTRNRYLMSQAPLTAK